MKINKKIIKAMTCLLASGMLFSSPVFSGEMSNYELTKRLNQIEEELKGGALSGEWTKRITLSGVIEVEAGYEKTDCMDRFTLLTV